MGLAGPQQARFGSLWASPNLNRRHSARCGPRRTSTGEILRAVGLAGPQQNLNGQKQKQYRMPDRMSEDIPDRMSEDIPDRMPDRMSEDMPDRMSEDMPDRMSDRISNRMPNRMPEDLPDRMSDGMN